MNNLSKTFFGILIFVELILLAGVFLFIPGFGLAEIVGSPNATSTSLLEIGNTPPDIINVSIQENAASLVLNPNATKTVSCAAVIVDYSGDSTINHTNATFYDSVLSSIYDVDDNNVHYTNSSCDINRVFGSFNGYNDDIYTALANCTFEVYYYANPTTWICNVTANDSSGAANMNYDEIAIDQLLALELPDSLDYGVVNATFVSGEGQINVTNVGNTAVNLSLEGYGFQPGDGNAMNCTGGFLKNISIEYEKFNLTNSTPGIVSHDYFIGNYTNLSTTASVRSFNLTYRQNDTVNEAVKPTWWRIYVPLFVAQNCTGNIIFGATTADGV